MLAPRGFPSSSAISLAGTRTTRTSVRAGSRLISDVLSTISPPGLTSGSNLSSEGRFMASSARGCWTTGEPTGRSPITTVQLQVPPRISGPYDGSHDTSLPSAMPA
jgi:hypothetical protein